MPDTLLYGLAGSEFARRRLGFDPDTKQSLLLNASMRRCLLNCSRQWGKSTVAAAKVLLRAESVPGCLVVVLSPSARQSAELLRKVSGFVRRMGYKVRGDGDNEISL